MGKCQRSSKFPSEKHQKLIFDGYYFTEVYDELSTILSTKSKVMAQFVKSTSKHKTLVA